MHGLEEPGRRRRLPRIFRVGGEERMRRLPGGNLGAGWFYPLREGRFWRRCLAFGGGMGRAHIWTENAAGMRDGAALPCGIGRAKCGGVAGCFVACR